MRAVHILNAHVILILSSLFGNERLTLSCFCSLHFPDRYVWTRRPALSFLGNSFTNTTFCVQHRLLNPPRRTSHRYQFVYYYYPSRRCSSRARAPTTTSPQRDELSSPPCARIFAKCAIKSSIVAKDRSFAPSALASSNVTSFASF